MTARLPRGALGATSRTLAGLSVLAGVALWLTPATFDLAIVPPHGPVRVAMLPPLWQIPVFVLAASLGIAAIARLLPSPAEREADPDAHTDADGDAETDADGRRRGERGERGADGMTPQSPPERALRASASVATGSVATGSVAAGSVAAGSIATASVATASVAAASVASASPADVLLPAAGVSLLLLPYLPWLPDALPILRVLAGPGRSLIWLTVAALIARGFWRGLPRHLRLEDAPPSRVALVLLVIGTLLCGTAGTVFSRTVLFPGGDEPHYLIIAQSLWRDGDLRIENNHRRGDYREYFARDLAPHYLARGVDRQIYSVHPIGVSAFLAPVYALGGYRLVTWVMALLASAAGALAWLLAWRASGSRAAATMAWMACCVNGPWVFNSFTVYPEVPAALMVMGVLLLMTGVDGSHGGRGHARSWSAWLACGLMIATLPWLSTKYAPMACALALVALGRIWWPAADGHSAEALVREASPAGARTARLLASAALLVPVAVSVVGWLRFFYVIWGTISPAAPYGAQRETRLAYLPAGGPGLLFDQEYGILAFAPALFLGLTGLVAMIAARGRARRLAIETLAVGGALLATVGAFHIWWGGSATTGRPIISGLLLLAVPFAWRYRQQQAKPALRAAYQLLIVVGVAIGLTLAFAQGGLLLAAQRSGVSRLLDWLSPTWTLWTIAPSFIAQPWWAAAMTTALWIAAALIAGWWLARRPWTLTPGPATLTALAACTVAIVALSIVVPVITAAPGDLLLSRLQTRGRSALLDTFDAARRPLAILYNPLRPIDPASPASLIELVATASDRRPRPPIPLLYNARWSLPAGRYTVELLAPAGAATDGAGSGARPGTGSGTGSDTGSGAPLPAGDVVSGDVVGTLSLLVGYSGEPAREWEVSLGRPGVWRRTFDLLTDINLIGFRASPEIERAAPTLRVRPETITDQHARVPAQDVVSAAMIGDTAIYFHDARLRAEGDGFWTPATSTVTVTVAAPGATPPVLVLRAGPVPTAVEIVAQGWRERVTLGADMATRVTLPAARSGVMRLIVETSTGFVPAQLDPTSQDRRALGAWIGFEGAATAAAASARHTHSTRREDPWP